MIQRKSQKDSGFIALMSSIIISVILILMATTLGFTGFYSRFNVLDSEVKERSAALADACVDNAILKLVNDPSYSGNATSTISGSDKCYIGPIPPTAAQKIFKTRGIFSNSHTNLKVTLDMTNFEIVSVEETPTF
jgi:hypothetical protein